MKLVLAGVAGFIGMHTALSLLKAGHEVVGVDNLNDYYDPQLKLDRLACLSGQRGFRFERVDIVDTPAFESLIAECKPQRLIHLAAQAGVRYSIENPMAYVSANMVGFMNVLEACRQQGVEHLVYASSSSVYGNNDKIPFSEHDPVDHPMSMYAASKRANELMAHVYSHLHGLATTGLRFFTVYGPWGRPDMAPIKFARAISSGETISVYNYGDHQRDFTYIDDIVDGVVAVSMGAIPKATAKAKGELVGNDPAASSLPFRIYNIGNNRPVALMDFLAELEKCLGIEAQLELLPAQAGDVQNTWADCSDLQRDFDYHPDTDIAEGMKKFMAWFKDYYLKEGRG